MIYIQRKDLQFNTLETVDEFTEENTRAKKCAYQMLNEYRMSDPSAHFYISSRPCKDWKKR